MGNEGLDGRRTQRHRTYEDPKSNLFRDPLRRFQHLPERRTIHVNWNTEKAELSFSVLGSPNGAFRDAGISAIPGGVASIERHLQEIAADLRLVSTRDYRDADAAQNQLTNIEAMGEQLFREIVPSSLQTLVKSWKDGSWVAISTNERWIPWELLHDGKGFFGNRFQVYRLPRIDLDKDEIGAGDRPKQTMKQSIRDGKIVHVVGGGLGQDQVARSRLHFSKSSKLVELHEQGLEVVLNRIADSKVVHFTCHGHRNPLRLQISKQDDPLMCLKIETVQMERASITEGCLVFANACNSTTSQPLFGRFLSFGWEFYAKGAGGFIGTMGAIPTEVAIHFAQSFYDALYGDANGDVFAAFRKAKQTTNATSPLHLLYSFYGNAVECWAEPNE